MNTPPERTTQDDHHKKLEQRVGRLHLRQRLGIEQDHESQVIGRGLNLFHIENWYSLHRLIRTVLRLTFLYRKGQRNTLAIETRHNTFSIARLPEALEGFTVLHLTDMHLDMHPDFPQTLSQHVQGLKYDLCVLTGDFRASTHGPIEPTLAAMKQVQASLKAPVYAVLGNHDSIRMVTALEAMDIQVLLNESVPITHQGDTFYLAGIDDPHYYRADNLEKASDDIPLDAVSVLLSHSPEMYRHAAHAGFDIMLSGHTHGGQICLPGGTPLMCNVACPRTYCKGLWTYHQLQGYTSVGSGASVVDVRLNCPPEVTLHRLSRY